MLLVKFDTSPEVAAKEGFKEYAKNIAMQVAAMRTRLIWTRLPSRLTWWSMRRKILTEQVINDGKPANIAEKIVVGRLGKFFKEVCLVDQPYVKDGDLSVQKYTANYGKRAWRRHQDRCVLSALRRAKALRSASDNFADEVASMIK